MEDENNSFDALGRCSELYEVDEHWSKDLECFRDSFEGLTQGVADHNKETMRFRHLEQKYIVLSISEALIIVVIAMARLRSGVGGYNELSPSERPQNRLVGCQASTGSQEPGSKRGLRIISEPDHCFS